MSALSDEGMWLLNEPPRQRLKDKYQFDCTDAWLERARLASIRFNNGGSGGFVSPHGLIVTNHHIGANALQKLSTPQRDLYRHGFLARQRSEELKCPDLELNVLQEIIDVTDEVNAAVRPQMPPAEAFAARRAVIASIEKKSFDQTKLRSEVVTLYQGGAYHLYRYKKYIDVRLVFAPEQSIAFFGGDTDNFEYPRYNLDICFFRAYENDQPAKVQHWFRWSPTGPQEGDLVFVTGHPGTTNRAETVAKLKHRRDVTLPYQLYRLRTMEALLLQFSERDPEYARMAATDLHRYANARKAFTGQLHGLLDPAILRRKIEETAALFALVQEKLPPDDVAKLRQAEKHIAAAQQKWATFEKPFSLLERGDAFASELFVIARHLVRLARETTLPNTERLREYRESNLESLKFQLFSTAPIYPELERTKLAGSLMFLAEVLGGEDPLVVQILAGKPPAERATQLIAGTQLFDPQVRRQIAQGGAKAIDDSRDPMIQLARLVDDASRHLRKRFEAEIEEVERQAYAVLARAKFQVYGRTIAPDATFTLRLAYGVVRGYEVDGQQLPPWTTFGEMFARSERLRGQGAFALPQRWLDGKAKLDLKTPFNFVSTADTIGGNSGSPVLNRAGELVGINFDRNRHGLVRNFVYTDVQARHIAVHSAAVVEALRKLYDCPELLTELLGQP